jgi:hypothetical protein
MHANATVFHERASPDTQAPAHDDLLAVQRGQQFAPARVLPHVQFVGSGAGQQDRRGGGILRNRRDRAVPQGAAELLNAVCPLVPSDPTQHYEQDADYERRSFHFHR